MHESASHGDYHPSEKRGLFEKRPIKTSMWLVVKELRFEWQLNAENQYVRTAVLRKDVPHLWDFKPSVQMGCNSFRNEYDIAVQFAPDAKSAELFHSLESPNESYRPSD